MADKVYSGTGNVFADIGLAHPERVLARAKIMLAITKIIQQKGLTQKQASEILRIPQPKVSCLMHGKLSMFSMDHLLEFLNALGNNVDIVINEKAQYEKQAMTQVLQGATCIPMSVNRPLLWRRFTPGVRNLISKKGIRPHIAEIISPILSTRKYKTIKFKENRADERTNFILTNGVL